MYVQRSDQPRLSEIRTPRTRKSMISSIDLPRHRESSSLISLSKLRRAILCAETKLSDLIVQNETRVLEFGGYGKQFIVQNNLSPDAFVQLSMMMAYYRLYGNVVCTYESVQTKKFSHGRTEAARSATAEAKVFMETFADSNASAEKDRGAARRS